AATLNAIADSGHAEGTFILVRHAEKVDESRDPLLSGAGQVRARALATVLDRAGLDAVYASQYRRTRLTALPAAEAAGLEIIEDPVGGDLNQWASSFAGRLRAVHSGETVLVVGHSNTIPRLARELCDCEVGALADSDYDRLFIVRAGGGRRSSLIEVRYGAASAEDSAGKL
ncbi:MAG: SixA phosphatase family protein, partial [Wenzhouxiangellaceae bacterium]